MAWLNTTPRPDPRSRRGQAAEQQPVRSRLEQMKKARITPQMPPNPAPHITARLIEIGLTEAAGMGAAPLSWREIRAWQESTCITLAPWEARLIRQLSVDYLAESRRAESENCPPPWRTEVTQRERDTEEAQLRAVLG